MVTKFGLIFFGAAAFLLVGIIVYPSVVSREFLPLVFVLTVMGAIGGFPELYFKLLNPELRHIVNSLQSNLAEIGVECEILSPKDSRAIKHRQSLGNSLLSAPVWGVIRLKDRNIDLIELRVWLVHDEGPSVLRVYAVQGSIKNEYYCRASTKNGDTWTGGQLADILNSDIELRNLLADIGGFPMTVRGVGADSYVAIYREELGTPSQGSRVTTFGMNDFLSVNEFRIYDIVAGHVKDLLT